MSVPAVYGGALYGYKGRFLGCLDANTGDVLWRSREPGAGNLIVVGDYLVMLTGEGFVILADAGS